MEAADLAKYFQSRGNGRRKGKTATTAIMEESPEESGDKPIVSVVHAEEPSLLLRKKLDSSWKGGFWDNVSWITRQFTRPPPSIGEDDRRSELLQRDLYMDKATANTDTIIEGRSYDDPFLMFPYILSACFLSFIHFFTTLPQHNFLLTLFKSRMLLHRAFLAVYRRQKLWLGGLFFHIGVAVLLGLVLGDSASAVYNVTSLCAIGPLLLLFGSLLMVYFNFRNHHVRQHYHVLLLLLL